MHIVEPTGSVSLSDTSFVRNERVIDGRVTRVWDLPGGQVEPGELLEETLRRELMGA